MPEIVYQFLFGWPGLAASLIATFAGLLLNRPGWIVAGAILIAPYSIYRGSITLVLPFLDFGAAWAVLEEKTGIAWVLSLPIFVIGGWFLWLAFNRLG